MICASCGADGLGEDATSSPCPKCGDPVLLDGRYRLVSILGRGANGITYRGERKTGDGSWKDAFAIKEMPLRTLESAKAMELFDREARILRELDHPSIPKYEDDFVFGEGKNASLYLVQELVSGHTLDHEASTKRYGQDEVFAIVAEIAEVLDYLHRRSPPVVHRDVKPKNVMRRDESGKGNGRLVLIDFGSVRDALSTGGGSTVAGTFGYMAPEQLAGKATPASDVYGLGALAIALLTRKEPDTLLGDDHRIDVRTVLEDAHVSEEALELLEAMLDPTPSRRPPRGGDVIARARACSHAEASQKTKPKTKAKAEHTSKKPSDSSGAMKSASGSSAQMSRRQRERWERKQKKREKELEEAARLDKEKEEARAAKKAENDERIAQARKERQERGEAEANTKQAERKNNRMALVLVGGGVITLTAIVLPIYWHDATRTSRSAQSTIGVPELYARPIALDVNGDGVEDIITTVGIDRGPSGDDDGPDTWGIENGHFDAFVQAVDGKSNKVLWAKKQGSAYTSLGNEAVSSPRIVLAARGNRIAIARVPNTGAVSISVVDRRTGDDLGGTKLGAASGVACDGPTDTTVIFEGLSGSPGAILDLEKVTARTDPSATCRSTVKVPHIADVPGTNLTNLTKWTPRFSREVKIESGPLNGRVASAEAGGALGVLTVDQRTPSAKAPAPAPAPQGITITTDYGGGVAEGGPDNTKLEVTAVQLGTGTKRWARSLASLGFTREVVDHIEMTSLGPLLFFQQSAGVALLDAETGARKWSRGLPKGHVLSSYTISKKGLHLHVFGPDPAVYGFLSKKLGSRILTVDLATGRYVRSIPEGPLDADAQGSGPDSAPIAKPKIDLSGYRAVTGCTCEVPRANANSSAAKPKSKDAGASTDASTNASADASASAGASEVKSIALGMAMRSSVESGGRKRFGVAYALFPQNETPASEDKQDRSQGFLLPHYDERRESLAPPKTLEGEVGLAVACSKDAIVYAASRVATAWSLTTKDELWTAELPVSRGEPKTVLGAGASLTCAFGRIVKDDKDPTKDRVVLPAVDPKGLSFEITLALKDGAVITK